MDKLSTTNVYKFERGKQAVETPGLLHNLTELSTFLGNLSTLYVLLQKKDIVKPTIVAIAPLCRNMKNPANYPQERRNVENLSTFTVDNYS